MMNEKIFIIEKDKKHIKNKYWPHDVFYLFKVSNTIPINYGRTKRNKFYSKCIKYLVIGGRK